MTTNVSPMPALLDIRRPDRACTDAPATRAGRDWTTPGHSFARRTRILLAIAAVPWIIVAMVLYVVGVI